MQVLHVQLIASHSPRPAPAWRAAGDVAAEMTAPFDGLSFPGLPPMLIELLDRHIGRMLGHPATTTDHLLLLAEAVDELHQQPSLARMRVACLDLRLLATRLRAAAMPTLQEPPDAA